MNIELDWYYKFDGEGDALRLFWEDMTKVRLEYLADPGPVGTAIRVNGFAYEDLLIEIEGIAYIGAGKQRLMPAGHWDWSYPSPFRKAGRSAITSSSAARSPPTAAAAPSAPETSPRRPATPSRISARC